MSNNAGYNFTAQGPMFGTITFQGLDGKTKGVLDLRGEQAVFSGDADASATILLECACVQYNDMKRNLSAAERDAARYRWIRQHGAWETEAFLNGLSAEEYDAALDEAMKP